VEAPSYQLPCQESHPCAKEGEEQKQQGQPAKKIQEESACLSWQEQQEGGEPHPEPGEGRTLHLALETRVMVHPAFKRCQGFNACPTQQQCGQNRNGHSSHDHHQGHKGQQSDAGQHNGAKGCGDE